MKLLLAQPAIPRFQWELEVLLCNIRKFTDIEVVMLFAENVFTVPMHFRKKRGVSVFVYPNTHEEYVAANRPYLLWQYFKENPGAEKETYFYIDSDIIFREWINCATLNLGTNKVVGSDCSGYISYEYIKSCKNGDIIAKKMADICGITVEQMKGVPGIGAHIFLPGSTAAFWERSYHDSKAIFDYLSGVETDLQKWTSEMWAQLWGWVREGKEIVASPELNFIRPTDAADAFNQVKILHNAGVLPEMSYEYFFKGEYVNRSPFGRNFDHVREDKATIHYVHAVQAVLN